MQAGDLQWDIWQHCTQMSFQSCIQWLCLHKLQHSYLHNIVEITWAAQTIPVWFQIPWLYKLSEQDRISFWFVCITLPIMQVKTNAISMPHHTQSTNSCHKNWRKAFIQESLIQHSSTSYFYNAFEDPIHWWTWAGERLKSHTFLKEPLRSWGWRKNPNEGEGKKKS